MTVKELAERIASEIQYINYLDLTQAEKQILCVIKPFLKKKKVKVENSGLTPAEKNILLHNIKPNLIKDNLEKNHKKTNS